MIVDQLYQDNIISNNFQFLVLQINTYIFKYNKYHNNSQQSKLSMMNLIRNNINKQNISYKFYFIAIFILMLINTSQSAKNIGDVTPSQSNTYINFTSLNQQLQTLNPKFLGQFSSIYTTERIQNLTDQQAGDFLFLLGKMYIYDILPHQIKSQTQQSDNSKKLQYSSKSIYLLGYFYLKMAAEIYQHGDAYYYLSILQFMKITPTTLIKNNIKNIINKFKNKNTNKNVIDQNFNKLLKQWSKNQVSDDHQELLQYLEDVSYDMESHHLHNTQHNLYLASLFGQTPAKLSLAYMLKDGISTQKNCSAAISYYLSVLKSTKIDTFQFPSDYVDRKSFQKQLYSRKKVDLRSYGQYDSSVLMYTSTFDEESLHAYQDVAMKYMTGEDGFPINQDLSAKMFQKITLKSKLARIMLGFMYLKGRGVSKNFKKARELFQIDAMTSKVAKQTLIVMKFYNLAFQNQRNNALRQMKGIYQQYVKNSGLNMSNYAEQVKQPQKGTKSADNTQQQNQQKKQQQKSGKQKTQKPHAKSPRNKYQNFRTPMIKYLVGTLVLSEQIKTNVDKRFAINLIDEAAKQGNTLALSQLGMIFIDGSDSSYDCEKSAIFFAKQSLSHSSFQQRIQMGKLGIKYEKYMFSFIKFVQLMMVGYQNAFINALYLIQVYRDDLFKFQRESWSVQQSKKNEVYKLLVKNQIIQKIDEHLHESLGFDIDNIFQVKNFQYLTTISSEQLQEKDPSQLKEYISYMKLKITSIGIQKHEVSILRFYKYKQTKDIKTLHDLANLGENSPHIYQSRFLLGRYYQHTNISGTVQQLRHRRAIQQYNRATKNKLLAQLIYLIEGGDIKQREVVISHFIRYITFLIIVGILLYRKRNKRMQEILTMEQKKMQEQQQQAQKLNKQASSPNTQKQQNNIKQQLQSQLKKNEFLFGYRQKEGQYKGPKFSQEEQQNMINRRNLMNIGFMMDEKMKNMRNEQNNKQKQQQKQKQKIEHDNSQPIIQEDQINDVKKYHNN